MFSLKNPDFFTLSKTGTFSTIEWGYHLHGNTANELFGSAKKLINNKY